MNQIQSRFRVALPFVCLAGALILCGWAFLRSEQYRSQSILNYSQTFEVQWRTTQIREHLARIHGHLRLASAMGETEPDLGRQIFLLNTNVDQLLKLEYVPKFLGDRDVELLRGMQTTAAERLEPLVDGGTDFESALLIMPDLEQRMFEVSGTAVAHAETLNTATHIAEAASRNRFLFAVALALAAVGYTIIHLRSAFARQQEQHLRSFSSLYAHMTRSRVAALKLFLNYQDGKDVKYPEMLVPAREAAQQLEAITNGLGTVACAQKDTRRERLAVILETIGTDRLCGVDLRISPDAAEVLVPATPIRLVLDELVRNAEAALRGRESARIMIVAKVINWGFKRRRLVVGINDNGPGMTPEVLARAKTPFFSTKAGSHTGVGLAGCAQMLSTLKGKFNITSQHGRGTSVEISIPI